MSSHCRFSIITINYNNIHGLEKTILSVVNQSCKDYEYIVIDGNSTDGSKMIIDNYSGHIDCWISESDHGVYDAMNKGLERVTGAYVFFLNSGDKFYSESTLAEISNHITKRNTPDILYGDVIYVNPETKEEKVSQFYLDKISLYNKMICHQAIFCQKHIFDTLGYFDTRYKIKADYDWLLRAVFFGASIDKANLIVAYYEEGGLSETHYNLYSAKEIPAIRKKYYSVDSEKFLRRFIFRPILQKPLKTLLNTTIFRNWVISRL